MIKNAQWISDFVHVMPHFKALGMRLMSLGDATAELALDYDPRLIGDPQSRVIHGGAVSALMDTCCGLAVLCHSSEPKSTATIDLRIDYMRPATPEEAIQTRAECYHVTRSVAFVRATTFDEDLTRPVASASGAFTVER
ncbi:MAG: PaaI family thioesterase [Aestuariivita sp.]|nr:PaaI family thioesterase [Aestuariivita sp.]